MIITIKNNTLSVPQELLQHLQLVNINRFECSIFNDSIMISPACKKKTSI